MEAFNKLLEITSRLDHLETAAEWIARETVHTDNAISQSGSLICVLADDIREKICALVTEIEKLEKEGHKFH